MNVQLRKGGAVHYNGGTEHSGLTPACNPWKGDANYCEVKDMEVTCKKCLKRMAKNAPAAEVAPQAKTFAEKWNELTETGADYTVETPAVAVGQTVALVTKPAIKGTVLRIVSEGIARIEWEDGMTSKERFERLTIVG